jgi:hypothetical protein
VGLQSHDITIYINALNGYLITVELHLQNKCKYKMLQNIGIEIHIDLSLLQRNTNLDHMAILLTTKK